MAYQSKARTARTTTTTAQTNQPVTVAWMNLSIVTADGKEIPLANRGIPLNIEKHLDVNILKSMGITGVTIDKDGNPIFEGNINTDKVFNLVAKVNLVKPQEDYNF